MRRFKSRSELTPEELEEIRKYAREYYKKNRAHIRENHRRWYNSNLESAVKHRLHRKEYRVEHRDKAVEYSIKWHNANKEKVLAYRRKYYNSHKEKCKEIQKRYYERNREKILKLQKEWYKRNIYHVREYYYKRKSQRIKNKYNIHTNHKICSVAFNEIHGMQAIYISKPKKDIMEMSLEELIATQNDMW